MSLGMVGLSARRSLAFALVLAAASPAAASVIEPTADDAVFGVWSNPKQTVHVDIRPCGVNACGVVVWATPEAEAKVEKNIGKKLLGLELFRNMVRISAGVWRGRAYAPDLNITFTGVAQAVDSLTLRAKGCLVGQVLCRSQDWKRVEVSAAD